MRTLPICFFTKNRTKIAAYALSRLEENLECTGYEPRIVICDDGSAPGHVDALVGTLKRFPYLVKETGGKGLGASMNLGISAALGVSDVFLRTEDDWVLQRKLDVGPWVDFMRKDSVGAVRMGMMFREDDELSPYGPEELGLLRLRSRPGRTYNLNNQVALVHEQVHELVGMYREDLAPQECERDFAVRFNGITSCGLASPWVCWPKGWRTKCADDPSLAFVHAGKSTLGHHQYKVPERYRKFSD